MKWFTLTNKSAAATRRTRALLGGRVQRKVRGGSFKTLVAIANSEVKWLHDCASDYSFTCRPASAPRKTYQTPCGAEMLAASGVGPHTGSCPACHRVNTNGTRGGADAPKAAKFGQGFTMDMPTPRIIKPAAHAQITAAARDGNAANAGAPVTAIPAPPSTLDDLIRDMETREEEAFAIAEEYGAALKAVRALLESGAALQKLQDELAAHRQELVAFAAVQS